jgi:ribosomal protein L30E
MTVFGNVEKVNQFSKKHINSGVHKTRILGELIVGILLCEAKRSFEALSKVFLDNQKNKTSVRSFFETDNFRSKDILKNVIRSVISETSRLLDSGGLYILLFDGTCIQRGGDTLVENAIKYRKKQQRKKGKRSTKAHTFTMGLLFLPNGTRVPIPHYTYYSRRYCSKHKMKYYTQHEDACMMIEYVRSLVPRTAEFIVVADGFFDSKIIYDTCKRHKAIFITCADSGRVYEPKKKLYERGLEKKKTSKTLIIKKGEEKYTREQIRYASQSGKTKKDVYKYESEKLELSKLGEIRIVYSWKASKNKNKSESYKILLCSGVNTPVRKIIELYALRWQIEIYFRELKSEIGLCDYAGKNFKAQERFIDVCLLAYLFLEWNRSEHLKETRSKKEKAKIEKLRSRGLILLFKKECIEETKSKLLDIIQKSNIPKAA